MGRLSEHRHLEERIVGPGIPRVGQVEFDRVLRTRGCRLAWHARRKVFVVWRDRGPTTSPMYYPTELGNRHYPLTRELALLTLDAIAISDAFARSDHGRAMDIWASRADEMVRRERGEWIAERMPDFMRDMMRAYRGIVEGVRASRKAFLDLGA